MIVLLRIAVFGLFVCNIVGISNAQNLSGVHLGDDVAAATAKIGFGPSAKEQNGPFSILKWIFLDGNSLSVTVSRDTGGIVYLESDWGGRANGTYTDFPDFYFGKTTLNQITQKFGGYGFIYLESGIGNRCYDLDDTSDRVMCFVTRYALGETKPRPQQPFPDQISASRLLLLGTIIGNKQYLDNIWGKERVYDKGYVRISLHQLQPTSQVGEVTNTPQTDEVPLKLENGVFIVSAIVNKKLVLPFVLDSGASDVSIPSDVLSTLIRTGTVGDDESLGSAKYVLADGSEQDHKRYLLHELKIGEHSVENVVATEAPAKGNLLLGQSFLSKLPAWTIDNQRHMLVFHAH